MIPSLRRHIAGAAAPRAQLANHRFSKPLFELRNQFSVYVWHRYP